MGWGSGALWDGEVGRYGMGERDVIGQGSGMLWDGGCRMLWDGGGRMLWGEGARHHRMGRGALWDTTWPRWSRTLRDKQMTWGGGGPYGSPGGARHCGVP